MNRLVCRLTGAALALTAPSLAAAEGPLDDTPAFSLSAVVGPSPAGVDFSHRIGLSAEKFGGWAVLGYDRNGRHVNGNNSTNQSIDLGVGGRYLFSPPGKAKAAPYVYAQGTTNRRSADTDFEERDKLVSDVKRYSLFAGFGGEVAVTKALTLGAELGLQHDVVDYDEDDVRLMTIHTHLDTSILVNVYF